MFLHDIADDKAVETDMESLEYIEIGDDRGESHGGDDDKGKSPDGEGISKDNIDEKAH